MPTSPSAPHPPYRNADAFIPTTNYISGHTSFTYDVSVSSCARTRTFPCICVCSRARCLVQRMPAHTHSHARTNEPQKSAELSRVPQTRAHINIFHENPIASKAVAALLRLPFLIVHRAGSSERTGRAQDTLE